HKRALSSFEALGILLGTARVQFDPATLWALLRTVGLYPPGTAVVLDSGHIALSLAPNPENHRRPSVRIVLRPDGSLAPQDQPEDWCPMADDRRVERVLRPEELNADAAEYLAA